MCHGFVSAGDALGRERPVIRCCPTSSDVPSAWWPNTIYYGAGSAPHCLQAAVLAPQYSDTCGRSTHWCTINWATGRAKRLLALNSFNLNAYAFGANHVGGDLVRRRNIKLVVFLNNLLEALNSIYSQCGGLVVTQPTANQKVSPGPGRPRVL